MKPAIEVEDDFGTAMHELSAEAIKPARRSDPEPSAMTALIGAVYSLNQRMEALDESILRKFETVHFERIEESLRSFATAKRSTRSSSIRSTKS
ncbi:MAG: hypothetical protein ABIU29_00300 [Chthoniobacterales bacterium]